MRNYANTAVETQLVHALDASATSLEVVQGAGYPDGNFAIVIDAEVILVGTRTGNIFSDLQRGYDGTVAASHAAGSWVSHTAIADDYRQIWNVPEHDHDDTYLKLTGGSISDELTVADKIGIRTSTPEVRLHIHGNWADTLLDGDNVVIRKPTHGAAWSRNLMQFKEHDGTTYTALGAYGSGNSFIYGYLGLAYNNNAIRWDSDNNVGIGGPIDSGRKLTVQGSAKINGDLAITGTVDGVDISAFKAAYDSHNHDFSELLNTPATASRWPTWDEVTDKPTEFPPENHDAGKVTSGTFDLARIPTISVDKGGTGATDAATARTNLGIGSMAERNVFIQSTEPVGMAEGDIWIEIE